jgi:hypothetical protein
MLLIRRKKLKIAIVLSGMQRLPERSFKSIQEIEKNHNVHVFCHCWENDPRINNYCFGSKNHPFPENKAEDFLKKYKNILYEVSDNIFFKSNFDNLWCQIKNKNGSHNSSFFSQFFSMNKANKLRMEYEKNNKKFDVVIRMRFDLLLKKSVKFNEYDLSKINIPYDSSYAFEKPEVGKPRGINDQFAFGPPDLMNCYFDVFDNIVNICNKGHDFCPHAILGQHLLDNKVPVLRPRNIVYNIHNS